MTTINKIDASNYSIDAATTMDEIVELHRMLLGQLKTRCSFASYTNPVQLNLSASTMTLKSIAVALPANTSFTYYCNSTITPLVVTPKTFNGNSQPGIVTVIKPSDTDKAYFSWANENLNAVCKYNKSTGDEVTAWEYLINKDSLPINANELGHELENLKITGKYYASAEQMSLLNDVPTSSACFIDIHARGVDCIQRLTENTVHRRNYERLVSGDDTGNWRYTPQLWDGAAIDVMNIGDMSSNSAGFFIKISATQWSKLSSS